ncbi:MAG: hypothetical protein Q9169_006393 [Polycauliona sp. 2 TL-2023]
MLYFLTGLFVFQTIHGHTIAPSCREYKSPGANNDVQARDLSTFIHRAYRDASSLALYARDALNEDQGDDDTRSWMFPDIDQDPDRSQTVYDTYDRVANHKQNLQPFNLDDPAVDLVFYCGDIGFERIDMGFFKCPYTLTVYEVGEPDLQRPCDSTSAITAQGWTTATGSDRIKYGIIFCSVLDQDRYASVGDLIDQRSDVIGPGWHLVNFYYGLVSSLILHELFHVTSYDTRGELKLKEVYFFDDCKEFVKDHLDRALAPCKSLHGEGTLLPGPGDEGMDEDEDREDDEE